MQIFPVFLPHDGCPHQCLFCNQHETTGRLASPEPEAVMAWLDRVLPPSGAGEIAYYGGSFSALPLHRQKAYLATARVFVAQGRVGGVRVSTRPDALCNGQAGWLGSAGVTTVEIGCQSFNDRVLAASRRGHSVRDIHDAVKACQAEGLMVGLQLMPGLPGAGREEAMASLRQGLDLGPAFVRIYPAVVFAGTGLAELWRRGAYQPLSLEDAVEITATQLSVCRQAGIPVIRLGLQPQQGLGESILAGPYHPAFGQLARARLWRRALAGIVADNRVVRVHPDDLSDALGHGRENIDWLQKHHALDDIRGDAGVQRGTFRYAGIIHQLHDTTKWGEQV